MRCPFCLFAIRLFNWSFVCVLPLSVYAKDVGLAAQETNFSVSASEQVSSVGEEIKRDAVTGVKKNVNEALVSAHSLDLGDAASAASTVSSNYSVPAPETKSIGKITPEEYRRRLFASLLNAQSVNFKDLASDSKAISIIGMFSDEKISGPHLQVLHWLKYSDPESAKNENASQKVSSSDESPSLNKTIEQQTADLLDEKLTAHSDNMLRALGETKNQLEEQLRSRCQELEEELRKREQEETRKQRIEEAEAAFTAQQRLQSMYEKRILELQERLRDVGSVSTEKVTPATPVVPKESHYDDVAMPVLEESATASLFEGSLWGASVRSVANSSISSVNLETQAFEKDCISYGIEKGLSAVLKAGLSKCDRSHKYLAICFVEQAPDWKILEKELETDFSRCGLSYQELRPSIRVVFCDPAMLLNDPNLAMRMIDEGLWSSPKRLVFKLSSKLDGTVKILTHSVSVT